MFRFMLLFGLLGLVACNSSNSHEENRPLSYSLEIVDSLQIDYLGDFWIVDYDSIVDKYLAWGNGDREVVILTSEGLVTSSFQLPTDGPEAIPGWINPIGLNSYGIEFMAAPNGFYKFDFLGNRVWRYKTPTDFFYFNGIKGDPFYTLGEEIAYLRPERGDFDWSEDYQDLFKKSYNEPILEVLDTVSQTSRLTMAFPPNSLYGDGNFHYWTFPVVSRLGKEWLLYFRNELKFWIYEEVSGEVVFRKEVSLEVSDAVEEIGISFENADGYNDLVEYVFPGSIVEIYRGKGQTVVVYHKGVAEEVARPFDRNSREGRREIEDLKEKVAAVFDENWNLIIKDLSIPQGLIFTTVLTQDEEILALKNQDYFGTEEDAVIYYKLKLLESKD